METETGFPEVALEWIIHHGICSDVELAHVSNVCASWRKTVVNTLCISTKIDHLCRRASNRSIECSPYSNRRRYPLLLHSLVDRLLKCSEELNSANCQNRSETDARIQEEDNTDEAFCVAWFAPEGILGLQLSENQFHEEKTNAEAISTISATQREMVSSGVDADKTGVMTNPPPASARFELQHQSSAATVSTCCCRMTNMDPFNSSNHPPENFAVDGMDHSSDVVLAEEWRGYQTAHQVLRHFGYTQSFLNNLLDSLPLSSERDALLLSCCECQPLETNLLVRGASVARPESYCLCYKQQEIMNENNRPHSGTITPLSRSASSTSQNQFVSVGKRSSKEEVLHQRRQQQRELLPRLVRAFEPSLSKPPVSLQFLNASGDSALCMITPPFACGPISEPITFFCVGIATEDGCFLSGLHGRFELAHGHLYPSDDVEDMTELSPVCIATERWEGDDTKRVLQRRNCGFSSDQAPVSQGVQRDDSSAESYGTGISSSSSCRCIFQGSADKIAEVDRDPELLIQGQLGPGSWHCYVAVFDGCDSRIRIDGIDEPTETFPSDDLSPQQLKPTHAMLDGLTIGSDHCFGLTLCNGQGPGGEGAIAEVAVFHGHMHDIDIERIERKLMAKHSIELPAPDFRESNELERKAHTLLGHDVRSNTNAKRLSNKQQPAAVPLRFLTRNAAVAWDQTDPVTGAPRRIRKIGAKNKDNNTSDW